jgi:hypothetical protein
VQFYDKLFTKHFSWRPKLDGLDFDFIDEEASWVERTFEENEILEVVKDMNINKAPGPDGFTMAIDGGASHAISKFEKGFNAPFIALIPKKILGLLMLRTFNLLVL